MTKKDFEVLENYMLEQAKDSAHDKNHMYRVLNSAIFIAKSFGDVDLDVLIAACLLHDIARGEQAENPKICHAELGGEMAYNFLLANNWGKSKALHVKECISSHRYRGDNMPESIEAKILFDSDKLEAAGAIGVARTLVYQGQEGLELSEFFKEYNYKLKKVYDLFFTEKAKEIALKRQKSAEDFYNALFLELNENYEWGR
ncbi:MAG: HD domain-containing protein [Defluviitaleaceae bacterium]|nr:HD domain-containing protein [Defluviitaleaceae bacterium]